MAHQRTSRLMRVVASGPCAFLAWQAEAQHQPDGASVFLCRPNIAAITWKHVTEWSDWLVLETSPCLVRSNACPTVGWQQQGRPQTLPHIPRCRGLPINRPQLLQLISELGAVPPRTGATKRELQEFLIGNILTELHEQKAALDLVVQMYHPKEVDEEIDSQMSEIISELGKKDGNNQDLQEYKKKKIAQRAGMKRKLQGGDMDIQKKPKKGKGKSKGKGKGKGRGRFAARAKRKGRGRGRVSAAAPVDVQLLLLLQTSLQGQLLLQCQMPPCHLLLKKRKLLLQALRFLAPKLLLEQYRDRNFTRVQMSCSANWLLPSAILV